MYDAIVIGSRFGGAPAAMLLAQHGGRRVLLVDPATSSDLRATTVVPPAAMESLARWGVLEPVLAAGETVHAGGVAVRRDLLDGVLRDAAVDAGAELRLGTTVTELLWSGDRIVGLRGVDADGRWFEELAWLVVGADADGPAGAPGWATVGAAGDLSSAFTDAELLVGAVDAGLDAAFHRYEQLRSTDRTLALSA